MTSPSTKEWVGFWTLVLPCNTAVKYTDCEAFEGITYIISAIDNAPDMQDDELSTLFVGIWHHLLFEHGMKVEIDTLHVPVATRIELHRRYAICKNYLEPFTFLEKIARG